LKKQWVKQKSWLIWIPVLLLVVVIGVSGAKQTATDLFSPLEQLYQYIDRYFYWPERIEDRTLLYGAMKGLVQQLDDPYSEFLDPGDHERWEESLEGEFSGVGIEITIKDAVLTVIAPLMGTPAAQAGVQIGDQILAIDGDFTDGITLTEASVKIRGEVGTTVVLLLRHRDGSEEEVSIARDTISVEAVTTELLAEERILYIRISRFDNDVTNELDQILLGGDLETSDGVILDLRNNPGGLLNAAIDVSRRFVDDGVIVITKGRVAGEQTYPALGNRIPNLPLAVLVNGGTASAAEIAAGAIRDHEMGILIGERTFGKGVIQRMIEFSDGSALKLTTGEYVTPLGHIVQGVGLVPDIELAETEDPIEAAIAWIDAHIGERMPIFLGDKDHG